MVKIYGEQFVVAGSLSEGGDSVYLIESEEQFRFAVENIKSPVIKIERYATGSVSLSQIGIVFKDGSVTTFDVCIQIISDFNQQGKFSFYGSEFNINKYVNSDTQLKTIEATRNIGEYLSTRGYVGIFGCDYICYDNELIFIELNPRYHASTFLTARSAELQLNPHALHIASYFINRPGENIRNNHIQIYNNMEYTSFVTNCKPEKYDLRRAPKTDVAVADKAVKEYFLSSTQVVSSPTYPVCLY